MALIDMKSDLAKGVGSKQTPQSFQDGHSATTVTGNKTFEIPPRIQIENKVFTAFSRQSEELTFQFNQNFNPKTIVEEQVPTLDKYYERAFNNADRLGARFEQRLGFDEPFILKGVGDRWGPGGLGKVDLGLVRAGAVTQAARTVADVQRIGKFLLTPRGVSFVLKQNVLQKMNANGLGVDGVPQGGSLVKKIGDVLGGKQPLPGPKRQRYNFNKDEFRNTPVGRGLGQGNPTVDELVDSDIRTWRQSSIIDSLPIGAHAARHLQPVGSPSEQLVKNISSFVVKGEDGVVKFLDGIDVAFPQVSLNPSFQAGDILTGASSAIKSAAGGIADVFPNIINKTSAAGQRIGSAIGDIVGRIEIPKLPKGRLDAFTTLFPDLIRIPEIPTPDFSALNNILGGLASQAASLVSSIPISGLKLPNISLPKLPNMKLPKLPNVSLPDINIGNPFTAIANVVKGIDLNFPKFPGFGGLSLGSNPFPSLANALPSIRLGAQISKGSLHFDMAAFDEGKAAFQSGLQELIKKPDAFKDVPAKAFGENPSDVPASHKTGGQKYGKDISEFGSQNWFRKGQKKVVGGELFANLQGEDAPKLYYTMANASVAQDNKGGLTNIYSQKNSYVELVVPKDGSVDLDTGVAAQKLGIGYDKDKKMPIATQAGFLGGAKFGVEDKNFPLNVEKKFPLNKDITPNFPANALEKSADESGKRLQRYEMLSYGQLNQEESYSEKNKGKDANTTRGIGHQGGPSRTAVDNDGNVIQVTAAGGYKTEKSDLVNLHPYGGSTADIRINDSEMDFVPLKFRDMVNGKWMIFRAILESISDTASPDYAEERYIGRPDKVYVYQGATRNVNITFKVMPKSVQELIVIWDKLNYLRGLVYPKIDNNRMVSPFFSFTLGDMFSNQPMIFQSLNYAIDTASTWEIRPGVRLPKLINVSADMRVIEDTVPQTTSKHYGFDWLTDGETFGRDPALPNSVIPNRSKYTNLWAELGPNLSKDIRDKLAEADVAVIAGQELVDSLKADINIPGSDIPSFKL